MVVVPGTSTTGAHQKLTNQIFGKGRVREVNVKDLRRSREIKLVHLENQLRIVEITCLNLTLHCLEQEHMEPGDTCHPPQDFAKNNEVSFLISEIAPFA